MPDVRVRKNLLQRPSLEAGIVRISCGSRMVSIAAPIAALSSRAVITSTSTGMRRDSLSSIVHTSVSDLSRLGYPDAVNADRAHQHHVVNPLMLVDAREAPISTPKFIS